MNGTNPDRPPKSSVVDWARSPMSITIWWVIPIVAGMLTDFLPLSRPGAALWPARLMSVPKWPGCTRRRSTRAALNW